MPYLTHRQAFQDRVAFWRSGGAPALPAGIMLPKFTAGVPSGWTEKYMGGNQYAYPRLRGASAAGFDTYYAKSNIDLVIANAGGHTGGAYYYSANSGGAGNQADAGHDHGGTLVATSGGAPWRLTGCIYQLDDDTDEIPAGMVYLAYDALDRSLWAGNWGRMYHPDAITNSYLSTAQNGGIIGWHAPTDISYTLSSDGAHNHGGNMGNNNSDSRNPYKCTVMPGAHDHGGTQSLPYANLTLNHDYIAFNFWYANLSQDMREHIGVCAFWPYTTVPPEGWIRFDGNHGLPDPQYKYVHCAYYLTGGGNIYEGTMQLSGSHSCVADGTHNHWTANPDNEDRVTGYHFNSDGSHQHVVSVAASHVWKPNRIIWHMIKRIW